MKGYGQFCPVAKAVEVLGERWTLLIVRELLSGARRFNDIHRGVPLMSPSLLAQRLRDLVRAGLVERRPIDGMGRGSAYHLTAAGEDLRPVLTLLGTWGQRWVRSDYTDDDLDVGVLMWDVRRFVEPGLGSGQTVVLFHFSDAPAKKRSWWLVLDDGEVDLCLIDPGRDIDLHVTTDVGTLTRLWMGDVAAGQVIADGRLTVHGRQALVDRFPSWFTGNPLASAAPVGFGR
ncbi:MAG: helix-turn-helix domain-containing protein [Nocardioides sp.]|nr:helix-turn-helix domain-containing protein [Nocardioides sp.]